MQIECILETITNTADITIEYSTTSHEQVFHGIPSNKICSPDITCKNISTHNSNLGFNCTEIICISKQPKLTFKHVYSTTSSLFFNLNRESKRPMGSNSNTVNTVLGSIKIADLVLGSADKKT